MNAIDISQERDISLKVVMRSLNNLHEKGLLKSFNPADPTQELELTEKGRSFFKKNPQEQHQVVTA